MPERNHTDTYLISLNQRWPPYTCYGALLFPATSQGKINTAIFLCGWSCWTQHPFIPLSSSPTAGPGPCHPWRWPPEHPALLRAHGLSAHPLWSSLLITDYGQLLLCL